MDDVVMGDVAAELVGALVVTLFAAGSLVVDAQGSVDLSLLGIAAVTGVGYAIATAVTRRSGSHCNPAVSLAAWLTGRTSAARAGAYVLAQLAGGVLAAAILVSLTPTEAVGATSAGATSLAGGLGLLSAVTWELVATFVYTLTVFATVLDARHRAGPALVGGAVFIAVALALPFTGASLNPARSLGPALLSSSWTAHWVYWIGPVLGASLAAGLYEGVLREMPRPTADAGER